MITIVMRNTRLIPVSSVCDWFIIIKESIINNIIIHINTCRSLSLLVCVVPAQVVISWNFQHLTRSTALIKHRHATRARVIFLWSLGDRSIHGDVYSDDLVNLISVFGCHVQQERNWEFFMYIQCYIGNGKITT